MDDIAHISFDLDNTLVSVSFDKALYNDIIPRLVADQENTSLDDAEQYVYAEYYKAKYIDQVDDWTSIQRWIDHFDLDQPNQLLERLNELSHAYDDVHETLGDFVTIAPITVFSNTNHAFLDAKTTIPPLDSHVSTTHSGPYDYGYRKSNKEAWRSYCDDLGTSPENLIHIGDKLPDDVQTPASLGITTYYLNRDDQPKGNGYHDLQSILQAIKDRLNQQKQK